MLTETRLKEVVAEAVRESRQRPNDTGRGNACTAALLRIEMKGQGLNQSTFAAKVGVHSTFINKVAKGQRGISTEMLARWQPFVSKTFVDNWLKCLREEER